MHLSKKLKLIRERKRRSLHVTMPHAIRNKEDVAKLFTGDFTVKLPRQTTRYCYVEFPNVMEKTRNLIAAKHTLINGKRVVISPVNPTIQRGTKPVKKKIVMPDVHADVKITLALFISNIKCGTKQHELKEAFVGCRSVKLLKPYSQDFRSAIMKMDNVQIAAEYLTRVRKPPVIRGHKLIIKPDTRTKHTKRRKPQTLKIYDK